MSITASTIPLGAVLLVGYIRRGEFGFPSQFGWTLFGVLILSLQFAVGAVKSKQRSRRVLLAECILVFGGTFTYLTITPVEPDLIANLIFAGTGCLLLLAFGGPLYLLGDHLNQTPQ